MRSSVRAAVTLVTVGMLGLSGALPASAADLTGNSWKVYTIKAATNSWANLSKATSVPAGGVKFDFQPYSSTTTGQYSVYLLTGVSKLNLTGKTITASVAAAATLGSAFYTRSTACDNTGSDAYVRLEFQSTTSGPYSPSDYWWSTGANAINLSTLVTEASDSLSFSTTNPADWSNINGQSGTDDPDGFANAQKNVKQIGLAFGSSCRYASGVAISGGSGSFHLLSYSIG